MLVRSGDEIEILEDEKKENTLPFPVREGVGRELKMKEKMKMMRFGAFGKMGDVDSFLTCSLYT